MPPPRPRILTSMVESFPIPQLESACAQLIRLLREGGNWCMAERAHDDARVLKSASGTAKYTLHCRHMGHALGFGTDGLASALVEAGATWDTEWPREMERAYTLLMRWYHAHTGLVEGEASSWHGKVFRGRTGVGRADGNLTVGYMHCRTVHFDAFVEKHTARRPALPRTPSPHPSPLHFACVCHQTMPRHAQLMHTHLRHGHDTQ